MLTAWARSLPPLIPDTPLGDASGTLYKVWPPAQGVTIALWTSLPTLQPWTSRVAAADVSEQAGGPEVLPLCEPEQADMVRIAAAHIATRRSWRMINTMPRQIDPDGGDAPCDEPLR